MTFSVQYVIFTHDIVTFTFQYTIHTFQFVKCTLSIVRSMPHMASIVLFSAIYGENSQETSDMTSDHDVVNQLSMAH